MLGRHHQSGPSSGVELEDLDKGKSYFEFCPTGNRSSKATELMHSLGFKHVHDIKGGMTG